MCIETDKATQNGEQKEGFEAPKVEIDMVSGVKDCRRPPMFSYVSQFSNNTTKQEGIRGIISQKNR